MYVENVHLATPVRPHHHGCGHHSAAITNCGRRLNGGRLTLSDEPGHCRFTLRLPSDRVNRFGDVAL